MLEKKITYEDYNGLTRTETFLFNLTEQEIAKMHLTKDGGLTAMLERLSDAKDMPGMIKFFDALILAAYGEKSDDGRRFVKSPELSKAFSETPAYDQLYMSLLGDDGSMAEFILGIIPEKMRSAAKQAIAENEDVHLHIVDKE